MGKIFWRVCGWCDCCWWDWGSGWKAAIAVFNCCWCCCNANAEEVEDGEEEGPVPERGGPNCCCFLIAATAAAIAAAVWRVWLELVEEFWIKLVISKPGV